MKRISATENKMSMFIEVIKHLNTVTAREHTNTFRAYLNLLILYTTWLFVFFSLYFIIYGAKNLQFCHFI
jgi:hypothetical protein